jgi:hypothetical protein
MLKGWIIRIAVHRTKITNHPSTGICGGVQLRAAAAASILKRINV